APGDAQGGARASSGRQRTLTSASPASTRASSRTRALVRRRRQLGEVAVAHLAARDAAGARGGVEHDVHPVTERAVGPEDDAGIRRSPGLEARLRVRRQRLRVATVVDRVVEDRLAPRVALEDADQPLRLDAVREDGDEPGEAALADVADGALDLLGVERRLAAV